MLSLSLKLLDAAAMDVAPSGGNGSKYFSLEYVFEDISVFSAQGFREWNKQMRTIQQ